MPFFISLDGTEKRGPFTIGELEELINREELKPEHLVWRNGLTDWRKAHSLSELNVLFSRMPPPLTSPPPLERDLSNRARSSRKIKNSSYKGLRKSSFLAKIFVLHGTYLTGWEFIWVGFVRVLLGTVGMIGLLALIVWLNPHSVNSLSASEDFLLPLGAGLAMLITRAQRARSVGGSALFHAILSIDILAWLYNQYARTFTDPFSLVDGILVLYTLWSYVTLLSDSYSPDKGGESYLWDYLKVNSKAKREALSLLLNENDALKTKYAIPTDVVVVPRLTPESSQGECQSIFKNQFYYLAVMHKKRAISIHDWVSLPKKEKAQCYRVGEGFENQGRLIQDLKERCQKSIF